MTSHMQWKKSAERIEDALRKSCWTEARSLIKQELTRTPLDHWLITRWGLTHYEQQRYKVALKITERALSLAPRCPLVLWDYGNCLDMIGREQEAITIWKSLLRRGPKALASGRCGEGERWGRALINDCRYRIGLAYADTGNLRSALHYLHRHLKNRPSSQGSIYKVQDIEKKINLLQQGINPRRPRRQRQQ